MRRQNVISFYKELNATVKLASSTMKDTIYLLSYSSLNEGHSSTLINSMHQHIDEREQVKFLDFLNTFAANRFKGRKSLLFFPKMFKGHNNIVYGRLRNFLYKDGLDKNVCNVIRFSEHQNNENMS